jgi:hypothetical protein
MKEDEKYLEILIKNYKELPTFIMGRIETTRKDFPARLDWKDTGIIIEKMGDGWRLPTPEETFYFIDLSKGLDIGKFDSQGNSDRRGYWTQSEDFKGSTQLRTGVYIDHKYLYGYNVVNPCLIRLVRDI